MPRLSSLPSLPAASLPGEILIFSSEICSSVFPETFRSVEAGLDASFVLELLGKCAPFFCLEVISSRMSSKCFRHSQSASAMDISSVLYRWHKWSATLLVYFSASRSMASAKGGHPPFLTQSHVWVDETYYLEMVSACHCWSVENFPVAVAPISTQFVALR